jgi:hypothetical protein
MAHCSSPISIFAEGSWGVVPCFLTLLCRWALVRVYGSFWLGSLGPFFAVPGFFGEGALGSLAEKSGAANRGA